ncbi:MAG: 30S ribosomal protein S18 [Chloroflexi bacterium]|nr:30S ribosomal protein S18 [Chloroflexota bacterium]
MSEERDRGQSRQGSSERRSSQNRDRGGDGGRSGGRFSGGRPDRGGRQDRGGRPGGRKKGRRRKEDYFAANNVVPDYKDVETLRRFMTDRAKIRPRRQTGLSAKNQRLLARQIKRARHLALLPFTDEHNRS